MNQLHFYIFPLYQAREKIELLRKRNDFELIYILAQIRKRINFFYLYNMIDEQLIQDIDDSHTVKN